MKRLYSCTLSEVRNIEIPYKIMEEKPSVVRAYSDQHLSIKKVMENVYWWLISKGKYRVWCAYDMGKVVHTSYLIPKCVKFPFLADFDYEIGPCNTESEYRGQGIYPAVLAQIARRFYANSTGGIYIIIDDLNMPSIRGASKAGFVALPGAIKRDCFKRYVCVKED